MKYPFAISVAVLCSATAANAQFQNSVYIAPYNPGLQLLNDSIRGDIEDDEGEPEPEQRRPAPQPSPHVVVDLNYTPSKAQTQRSYANMVAGARRTSPANADHMAQIFASTDVIGQMDQIMRPMGLRADNVADAFTVWMVTSWRAANSVASAPDHASLVAAKRQMEKSFIEKGQLSSLNNAQKQEMAETLLIMAMLVDMSIREAAGNPEKQANLARVTRQGALGMYPDLDLAQIKLTQDGFVNRAASARK